MVLHKKITANELMHDFSFIVYLVYIGLLIKLKILRNDDSFVDICLSLKIKLLYTIRLEPINLCKFIKSMQ